MDTPAPAAPEQPAPGGPDAVERGCSCSVLANAAYRTGAPEAPLVDPGCPVHAARPAGDAPSGSDPDPA